MTNEVEPDDLVRAEASLPPFRSCRCRKKPDTVTYGLSLAVIGASLRMRATAALAKGLSLSLMALWVFGATVYHTLILGVPQAEIMVAIDVLALAADLASVFLLLPYKDGDANVRSV